MTKCGVAESVLEQAALAWLKMAGWSVRNGGETTPAKHTTERGDYGQVVLAQRLRDVLVQRNHGLPTAALDDAFNKLTRADGTELSSRNRVVHCLFVNGVMAVIDLRLLCAKRYGLSSSLASRSGRTPSVR